MFLETSSCLYSYYSTILERCQPYYILDVIRLAGSGSTRKTMEFTWNNIAPGATQVVTLNHNLNTFNLRLDLIVDYTTGQRLMYDFMSVTWPTSIIGYVSNYTSVNSCDLTLYNSNMGGPYDSKAIFTVLE